MSREISGFFALILDAASAGEVMYVSEVVDRFLVPYLQSQSQLAKSLRDYLPKRHQSWKYFLDRMEFNDEEKVLFALNCDPLPEDSPRLLEACESLIKDFNSKYLAKVVSEIRGMETDDVFRVPERHTEVDVFYATDRHVTEDGEYIGQHSAMSDWRKGKELHYGITTVGIPDEGGRSRRQESPLKHVEILSVDTTLQHEHLRFVDEINSKLLAQACTSIHLKRSFVCLNALFVCHVEISQITLPPQCSYSGVYRGGFVMFRPVLASSLVLGGPLGFLFFNILKGLV